MSKLRLSIAAAAGLVLAGAAVPFSAGAAILGPHAADCEAGAGKAAMLVRISGFKSRTGMVRVQSYGGDPRHYFDKGSYLERVEIAPPASGVAEVCMVVPHSGTYAISVRHDVNGDNSSGMSDGGGLSGNPSVSLMDLIFKRRPDPEQVAVKVEKLTRVPVVLNYVQGGAFKPIATAER